MLFLEGIAIVRRNIYPCRLHTYKSFRALPEFGRVLCTCTCRLSFGESESNDHRSRAVMMLSIFDVYRHAG
jgi:hypothetical protein